MRYEISDRIFAQFPSFCRQIIVVTGAVCNQDGLGLEERFRSTIAEVRNDPRVNLQHPRIQRWVDAYKKLNITKTHGARPSTYTLISRIKSGKGDRIPFVAPIVCISNLIALTHLFPSGAIDASAIRGGLFLGHAVGGERFEPVGADGHIAIDREEIVLADAEHNIFCRAWNSRAGRAGLLKPSTQSCLIEIDYFADQTSDIEIDHLTELATDLVEQFCGGRCQAYRLDSERNTLQFNL